ncbi:MAG TPA: hypothetical protein VF457_11220 [Burkholderiaceae bacterium]
MDEIATGFDVFGVQAFGPWQSPLVEFTCEGCIRPAWVAVFAADAVPVDDLAADVAAGGLRPASPACPDRR